jgi:hypothetical protein
VTGLLFGQAVDQRGLEASTPDVALAWIAKAYADRARLRNPRGLVAERLRSGAMPPSAFLDDPTWGLPREFLSAAGITDPSPDPADPERGEREEVPDTIFAGADAKIVQAWCAVQELLEDEMPRMWFQRYVRGTFALAFDGCVLRVAAEGEDVREWLDGRLRSTAQRLLVGILNRAEVEVEFVPAPRSRYAALLDQPNGEGDPTPTSPRPSPKGEGV